jgi:hypothetical protein
MRLIFRKVMGVRVFFSHLVADGLFTSNALSGRQKERWEKAMGVYTFTAQSVGRRFIKGLTLGRDLCPEA